MWLMCKGLLVTYSEQFTHIIISQSFWILSKNWNCLLNLHIDNTRNKSTICSLLRASAFHANSSPIIGNVSGAVLQNNCVFSLASWNCLGFVLVIFRLIIFSWKKCLSLLYRCVVLSHSAYGKETGELMGSPCLATLPALMLYGQKQLRTRLEKIVTPGILVLLVQLAQLR